MIYTLVKGRHEHRDIVGVSALFDTLESNRVFDFDYHKKIIHAKLTNHSEELKLYVTGMTPVLISVINYCRLFNMPVVLYHYDKATKRYRAQSVV